MLHKLLLGINQRLLKGQRILQDTENAQKKQPTKEVTQKLLERKMLIAPQLLYSPPTLVLKRKKPLPVKMKQPSSKADCSDTKPTKKIKVQLFINLMLFSKFICHFDYACQDQESSKSDSSSSSDDFDLSLNDSIPGMNECDVTPQEKAVTFTAFDNQVVPAQLMTNAMLDEILEFNETLNISVHPCPSAVMYVDETRLEIDTTTVLVHREDSVEGEGETTNNNIIIGSTDTNSDQLNNPVIILIL